MELILDGGHDLSFLHNTYESAENEVINSEILFFENAIKEKMDLAESYKEKIIALKSKLNVTQISIDFK